jgi:hypothetical protein
MASYNPYTGALVEDDVSAIITSSFTRPADTTAYAAGDVVNNSTTAPTVLTMAGVGRRNGGSGEIVRISLTTNNATVTNGTFRVYIFNATHATQNDNAAWTALHANRAALVGYVDLAILSVDSASGTAAVSKDDDVRMPFVCAAGDDDLYVEVVATGAYTPASAQVFQVQLGVKRD